MRSAKCAKGRHRRHKQLLLLLLLLLVVAKLMLLLLLLLRLTKGIELPAELCEATIVGVVRLSWDTEH